MSRCFVLFHDCLHDSVFRSKSLNTMVGKIMGGLVLNDFNVYRMYHMNHHQLIGDEVGCTHHLYCLQWEKQDRLPMGVGLHFEIHEFLHSEMHSICTAHLPPEEMVHPFD
jgi:hypothetical protein